MKVIGTEIGKLGSGTKSDDIRFDTYGFGVTYRMNAQVKRMTYYDIVRNESTLIPGYSKDIRDSVMTIRLQFKY